MNYGRLRTVCELFAKSAPSSSFKKQEEAIYAGTAASYSTDLKPNTIKQERKEYGKLDLF